MSVHPGDRYVLLTEPDPGDVLGTGVRRRLEQPQLLVLEAVAPAQRNAQTSVCRCGAIMPFWRSCPCGLIGGQRRLRTGPRNALFRDVATGRLFVRPLRGVRRDWMA